MKGIEKWLRRDGDENLTGACRGGYRNLLENLAEVLVECWV